MRQLVCAALLALAPMAAKAGAPCPIPITLYDLGSPEWLDNDALLADLTSQETWLGIQYRRGEAGLRLTHVHRDGAAETAGLRIDDIILTLNGAPAADDARRAATFDAMRSGDTLRLTVQRNGQVIPLGLKVGGTDPVVFRMVKALSEMDCRSASVRTLPEEDRRAIMAQLFNESRGFRCDDAHLALRTLGERYQIRDVYFVRGSRRILLTMPYWGTLCLPATQLDGANLTDPAALATLDRVIGGYVQDRFENP